MRSPKSVPVTWAKLWANGTSHTSQAVDTPHRLTDNTLNRAPCAFEASISSSAAAASGPPPTLKRETTSWAECLRSSEACPSVV